MHITHDYAKIHLGSLKILSKPSSFAFWCSWAVWTATLFHFALIPLEFCLLLFLHTKLLSPRDQTQTHLSSPPKPPLQFLSRIRFWQKLHYQVSCIAKPTPPPSISDKETPIWKVWLPSKSFRCHWHFIKHLQCMTRIGMALRLQWELTSLTYKVCPLAISMQLAWPC